MNRNKAYGPQTEWVARSYSCVVHVASLSQLEAWLEDRASCMASRVLALAQQASRPPEEHTDV